MGFTLRYYQVDALDVMRQNKERILISAPTGAGKTVILATYASEQEGRTLILTPSTELREQTLSKLKTIDPNMDVGSVQGSISEYTNKILVGTPQSLAHKKSKRIDEILKHGNVGTVIIDEVHIGVERSEKIIKMLKNKNIKVIGVSATVFNPKLVKLFDGIDYHKPLIDMIDEGFLCEPVCIRVTSQTSLLNVSKTAGDYNQKELEETVDNVQRNKLIVKSYQEYCKERKSCLVFCVGIDHLNHVVEEFKSEGIYCKGLDSTNSKEDRVSILEEFKSGKLPVLVNCGVLTTGFDYEALDSIIIARPTQSKSLYIQILGRALRTYPSKNDALIIDITDNCKAHDLMSLSNVFDVQIKHGETPRQARVRVKQEKAEEEIRKQEEERRRIEAELQKQQELEIIAQRIKLFNKDMKSRVEEANLDWFRVNNLTYALSIGSNAHYVVENQNDTFIMYYVTTDKENRSVQERHSLSSMKDMVTYIEKIASNNTYTVKNSDWKLQQATEAQRKFVSHAKTKWEVHKVFAANTINSTLNKYHKDKLKGENATG